jgi:hypothetical protein
MKTILCLVCVFGLVITGCDSDLTPIEGGSTLNFSQDTLVLTATDTSKVVELSLTCGCAFSAEITKKTGDTTAVTYVPIGPLTDKLAKHSLRFSYSPTITPGPHSMILDFEANKQGGIYKNSLVVEVR